MMLWMISVCGNREDNSTIKMHMMSCDADYKYFGVNQAIPI